MAIWYGIGGYGNGGYGTGNVVSSPAASQPSFVLGTPAILLSILGTEATEVRRAVGDVIVRPDISLGMARVQYD